MYRGPAIFWGLVIVLLTASLMFGWSAEGQRRRSQPNELSIATGDLVQLQQVVDGDTVLVRSETGEPLTIRLLGIKAFSIKPDKDPVSSFGKAAMLELERLLRDRPIRVMLHTVPKDKHGRHIAELFVEDREVSVELVQKGLVLVYTAYPFPSMPLFLQQQELARGERRGLWAVPEVAKRADMLIRQWSREAR